MQFVMTPTADAPMYQ